MLKAVFSISSDSYFRIVDRRCSVKQVFLKSVKGRRHLVEDQYSFILNFFFISEYS